MFLLSQFNRYTLASEVKCLRVIKKSSKQRAEYLQKQDDILSQENKAKSPSALQGRSRKEGLCTRQLQGRSRKQEGLCTRQLQGRSRKQEGLCTRQLQGRSRKEEGLCTRQLQGRSRKEEGLCRDSYKAEKAEIIQLPLRHLKGIGIGMTPLSDWLNVLPRGSGIAWVTELPLPPKDMSWHVVLH